MNSRANPYLTGFTWFVAAIRRSNVLRLNSRAKSYEIGFTWFVAVIRWSNRLRQLRRVKMEEVPGIGLPRQTIRNRFHVVRCRNTSEQPPSHKATAFTPVQSTTQQHESPDIPMNRPTSTTLITPAQSTSQKHKNPDIPMNRPTSSTLITPAQSTSQKHNSPDFPMNRPTSSTPHYSGLIWQPTTAKRNTPHILTAT